MSQGPLSGIKVIEISTFQQGPVAGMRLGDLGADVIKIEPKEGDPARRHMRTIEAEFHVKGDNYYFEHANRNKRGIVLDMKKETGHGGFSQAHRFRRRLPEQYEHWSSPAARHRAG